MNMHILVKYLEFTN
jgi:hypothetical protein